ncbi:twin-arginine translocation pathway signal protein [Erythrobacter oryzae]|uniref:twin-arginine translocation pathway signal protein n=1 Tax=Erythrobacter oryzae TaxID=3019556 RepID=UPI0025570FB8|nr:twin-arginine translocation pathway signal protein [Erythrobacter sp. COR-2]
MRQIGAMGMAAAALLVATTPWAAEAQTPAASAAPAPWIAPDFAVPTLIEGPGFKLVPLGPALTEIDYRAYMSSIAHLQATFTRSTGWPNDKITLNDAAIDMETEAGRFARRESFAYAVLTPDGTRERGCVYVYPSKAPGHDAQVVMWVTAAEYEAGFDAELYAWTQKWLARDWPFSNVAYPGRAIAWEQWDAMVAKSKGG